MKKKSFVLIVAWCALLIFSGLGIARAGDPSTIEIGAFSPPSLGAFLPPVITEAQLDVKHGIKVTWTLKPPKAYNMGYFSGEFKVGASGALLNDAIRRVKGHKTVWLFNTFDYFGTVLSRDPAIKTLKDLEGRKLAASKVTTNYAMYRYFAKKEGVDLDKIDTLSASVPALLTFLTAERVDAVQLWEPAFTKIMVERPGKYFPIFYHKFLKKYAGVDVCPYLGVSAHESWIKENPGMIQKIYNSFKDAEKWIWEHPSEAAEIIAKKCKIPVKAIQELLKHNERLRLNVVPAEKIEREVFEVFKMANWEGHIKKLPDRGIIYHGLK